MIQKICPLVIFLSVYFFPGSLIYTSGITADQEIISSNSDMPADTTVNQSIHADKMQNFEEAYLLFNYRGIVKRTLVVYYEQNFFLPLMEIFDELMINY
ncbi:MAG: hypothetical protein MUE91_13825, partial [Ignavibacteriaceae bacterium]|nr:hypothetical protein [Ignavibacteriaceae bacterium]